ncbi:MAG: twin-arginine translocation signal domain-containing protein, partial [Planctomycetota bacterium]
MLSRRKFLEYAGLAAASAVVGEAVSTAAEQTPQTKPNFLLIIGDDCTYNDLPVYGGQNAETPNIDRLAA